MSEVIEKTDTETKEPLSIVTELVDKHTPKTVEKSTKSEEKKDQSVESASKKTTDEPKADASLITKELAEQLGIPKDFIGKPLSEIGKSYSASVDWGNTNNKELIQLKTDLETLKGQVSQTQLQKAEKEAKEEADKKTETLLGEIPDYVDDPTGLNKWLIKRDSLMAETLRKEFREELKEESDKIKKDFQDNPTLKKAEEMALEQTVTILVDNIQGLLPKGVGAGEVLDAWLEDNGENFNELVDGGFYKDKPEKLVKDVINWFKAQSYDSLKDQKESDIIKKIHKETKKNLEKISKTATITKVIKLDTEKKETEGVVSKMVADLQKRLGLTE